jgi:hypothetical protein
MNEVLPELRAPMTRTLKGVGSLRLLTYNSSVRITQIPYHVLFLGCSAC